MILAPGTYCFSSVTLSGGSTLQVNEAVRIYLDIKNSGDKSDFSGGSSGGVVNTTGKAENLQIFSMSSSQGITLSGGSQAYMAVYAPNSPITFSGGSDLYGAVSASCACRGVCGQLNARYAKNGRPFAAAMKSRAASVKTSEQ